MLKQACFRSSELYQKDNDEKLRGEYSDSIQTQLTNLDVSNMAKFTLSERKALRIKQKTLVGYEVIIEGLSPEKSILIQEKGIGGKRKLGAGFFLPVKD